jgi:hypothetical protein
MLDALQAGGAVERTVRNVTCISPLPSRELSVAAAFFGDVIVAGLVGDIDNVDVALRSDALPDVVDEAARLDTFADDENFVAGTQFQPVIDDVARGLRLAPHERKPAEQDRAAPALLLVLVEDHLAEAADIIGLHPIPRIFAYQRIFAGHDVLAAADRGYALAGLSRMWMFFSCV